MIGKRRLIDRLRREQRRPTTQMIIRRGLSRVKEALNESDRVGHGHVRGSHLRDASRP